MKKIIALALAMGMSAMAFTACGAPSESEAPAENAAASDLTSADTFLNKKVDVEIEGEIKEIPYARMAMGTTITMEDLHVDSVYTTDKEDSSSNGAMTIECTSDGIPVTIRTAVLKDEDGNIITEELYMGETIDVRGVVDYFDGVE